MIKSRTLRGQKETTEIHYYISSNRLEAEALNNIAQAHWGIENQLHWRLDVVFNEDKACIRNGNAAENIALLRKWALNILRTAKEKPNQSIKSIMRKNTMSPEHLVKVVNKIFHA